MSLLFATALIVLSTAGCARELALREQAYAPRKDRIVFMPAMVALYTLSSEGQMATFGANGPELGPDAHLEFQEKRSKEVRAAVDRWLKTYVDEHDSRIAELDEVAQTRMPANTFYNVMDGATNAIVLDWLESPWANQPLSHWGADARFKGWDEALDADYVVFVKFKGAYETRALQSSNALASLAGASRVVARRIATLAVVDLRSGGIVSVQGIKFEGLAPVEVGADLTRLVQALVPE
jgi:hypothetical protein